MERTTTVQVTLSTAERLKNLKKKNPDIDASSINDVIKWLLDMDLDQGDVWWRRRGKLILSFFSFHYESINRSFLWMNFFFVDRHSIVPWKSGWECTFIYSQSQSKDCLATLCFFSASAEMITADPETVCGDLTTSWAIKIESSVFGGLLAVAGDEFLSKGFEQKNPLPLSTRPRDRNALWLNDGSGIAQVWPSLTPTVNQESHAPFSWAAGLGGGRTEWLNAEKYSATSLTSLTFFFFFNLDKNQADHLSKLVQFHHTRQQHAIDDRDRAALHIFLIFFPFSSVQLTLFSFSYTLQTLKCTSLQPTWAPVNLFTHNDAPPGTWTGHTTSRFLWIWLSSSTIASFTWRDASAVRNASAPVGYIKRAESLKKTRVETKILGSIFLFTHPLNSAMIALAPFFASAFKDNN